MDLKNRLEEWNLCYFLVIVFLTTAVYLFLKKKTLSSWMIDKICWVFRDFQRDFDRGSKPEKRYAVCKSHVKRLVKISKLEIFQQIALSNACLMKQENAADSYKSDHDSCLYYYDLNLIWLSDFCSNCKLYFVGALESQLKRVKIYNGETLYNGVFDVFVDR